MFFNSFTYLLFLPTVGIILYAIPVRYQWFWLFVCSAFFYITLFPEFLILFVALIVLNYFLGIEVEKAGEKRNGVYILSLCANILTLAFFKYFGILDSIISSIKDVSMADNSLKLVLPIGLSFFIFSMLSYLIEIKRGTITAERHIGIFSAAMLFFPKIMQGPIERPGTLMSQFKEGKILNYNMIAEGSKLILLGFFKKMVVAERLGIYVDAVYGNIEQHSGVTFFVATIFYSFQIYADFSGYTDIALGSAKILGINLTNNFRRPYFASSIKEFWSRWHISFSTWLRDYLFLPMAVFFAKRMKKARYLGITSERWIFLFAVNITFIVCGMWHGDGLNFIIWGIVFGLYQTVANWTSGLNKEIRKSLQISKKSITNKIFNISITFLLVTFSWIFFRADNATEAFQIVKKIYSFRGDIFFDYQTITHGIFGIVILFLIDLIGEKNEAINLPFKTNHWLKEAGIYAGLAVIIILTGVFDGGQFIYFQF